MRFLGGGIGFGGFNASKVLVCEIVFVGDDTGSRGLKFEPVQLIGVSVLTAG